MKKKGLLSGVLLAGMVLLSNCTSTGIYHTTSATLVELTQPNYKIIANSLTGQAKSEYLLGYSFGVGMFTHSMALIPLTKDRALYKNAIEDLWKNYEMKFGSPVGKKLALINVRYDSEFLNVFVYTSPKLIIIADVIEFTD